MTPAVRSKKFTGRTRVLKKQLAYNLRCYRKKKDWTQKQLAEELGMRQQHISRLEKGDSNASLRTIAALAVVLAVNGRDLLVPIPKEKKTRRIFQGGTWVIVKKKPRI